MPESIINTGSKVPKQLQTGNPEGATNNVPQVCIVADNIDATRTGKLIVYPADQGGSDPNATNSGIPVSYLSPFYGKTTPQGGAGAQYGDYINVPHSYGFWATAPDVGTKVLVVFVGGKQNQGYVVGCIPEPGLNFMLPAVGSSGSVVPNDAEAGTYGGATRLPVAEINSSNPGVKDSPAQFDQPRPVHSYAAAILNKQGLIRDDVRGVISSSAMRETPSRVFGISTPGAPIYKSGKDDATVATTADSTTDNTQLQVKARRGGHSFVMDDGTVDGKNKLIRIRTSEGHQITMSDDGDTLFITHANGLSWIELGKGGTIDAYATNSINLRTQGDFNIHADQDVNIHAGKNFNTYAGEDYNQQVKRDLKVRVGRTMSTQVISDNLLRVGGSTTLFSVGGMNIGASGAMKLSGSRIDLNTSKVKDPNNPKDLVAPYIQTKHTDTRRDSKGWVPAPGLLDSITSRAPAHQPWLPGSGLEVPLRTPVNNDQPQPQQLQPPAQTSQAQADAGNAPSVKASQAAAQSAPSQENKPPPVNTAPQNSNPAPNASTNSAAANSATSGSNTSSASGTTNAQGAPVQTQGVQNATANAQASQQMGSGAEPNNATNKAVLTAIQSQPVSGASVQAAAAQRAAEHADMIRTQPASSYAANHIGPLGMTPQQMESSGMIKPGTAPLVERNLTAGLSYDQAMAGLKTTNANVKSPTVQTQSYGNLLAYSQAALIGYGVLTGKEPDTAVLGIIKAGADYSAKATAASVKNSANVDPKTKANVKASMSGGSFAGQLATSLKGGLTSLGTTVKNGIAAAGKKIESGITSVKNFFTGAPNAQTAAVTPESAASAITASLPNLQGGQPNFLNTAGGSVTPAELTPAEVQKVTAEAKAKNQNVDTALRNYALAKRVAQGIGLSVIGQAAGGLGVNSSTPLSGMPGTTSTASFQSSPILQGVVGGLGALGVLSVGPGTSGTQSMGNVNGVTNIKAAINGAKVSLIGTNSTKSNNSSILTSKQTGNIMAGTISALTGGIFSADQIKALAAANRANATPEQKAAGEAAASQSLAAFGIDQAMVSKLKSAASYNSSGTTKPPSYAQGTSNLEGTKDQLSRLITNNGKSAGVPLPQISGQQVDIPPEGAALLGGLPQPTPEQLKENETVAALRDVRDKKLEAYKKVQFNRGYSANPADPQLVQAEADAKAAYLAANKEYEDAKGVQNKKAAAAFLGVASRFL